MDGHRAHPGGDQGCRLELTIAYATLLRRLPDLRPVDPESTTWKHGMITRAPAALPVTW